MTKQTSARPIHLYDTQLHRIACEEHVADDHSTKHVRAVTCTACIAVVRERLRERAASSAAEAHAGV
jgi:predicted kinase